MNNVAEYLGHWVTIWQRHGDPRKGFQGTLKRFSSGGYGVQGYVFTDIKGNYDTTAYDFQPTNIIVAVPEDVDYYTDWPNSKASQILRKANAQKQKD